MYVQSVGEGCGDVDMRGCEREVSLSSMLLSFPLGEAPWE